MINYLVRLSDRIGRSPHFILGLSQTPSVPASTKLTPLHHTALPFSIPPYLNHRPLYPQPQPHHQTHSRSQTTTKTHILFLSSFDLIPYVQSRTTTVAMDKTLQAVLAATGSFFAITVIFASVYLICKGAKSNSTGSRRTNRAVRNRTTQLTRITVDESASFDPSLKVSMDEVVKATKNFNKDLVVGDGGFGLVYKAQLSDGLKVAIKKLDPDAFQGFREFRAEMETLGKLWHPNLVRILGYCVSGADRILIYEFMERGNLDRWLHDSSSTDFDGYDDTSGCKLPLSWKTRNKIVRGVANGLAFLHSLEKPIIHRDIKASNVLLDREYEAHIADFGLARSIDMSRSHVSTQFAGTMGYMPPEYKEGFTGATVKADVYSFGILMLEVATGRRPNLPSVFDKKEMGLVEWARKMVAQNRQMEMVDPSISREDLDEGNVKKYFEIAGECAHESSRQRPPMKDVIELLKELPT